MLRLIIKGDEYFNEETLEFSTQGDVEIDLEHSLVSLSKWESKHKKPFLSNEDKTPEEIFSYVESMILSENFPGGILRTMSSENINQINEYIDSKESATTFGEMPAVRGRGETITSELIYYWMVAFRIPFICETWHLNRLFSLIRICNLKNNPPKNTNKHELAARNRELNERRKRELGTKG